MAYGDGYPQFGAPRPIMGVMKAGAKDPRALLRNRSGFDPSAQPDQQQFVNDTAAQVGNTIPLADANFLAKLTSASQSRIQCNYVPYPFTGALTANKPQLLIPRNTNRSNFYVINLSGAIIFVSFGAVNVNVPGFPLADKTFFAETNGVIGINDIYVTSQAGIAAAVVLGYEGVPDIGVVS